MGIPDAVMTDLQAISDSPAVASHPQVETFYNIAAATVNTSVWLSNASYALALMTAHLCLVYPANSSHIDRAPVAAVPGSDGSIRYMDNYKIAARDASLRQTAPGRLYLDLRKRLIAPSYSPTSR